MVQAPQCPFGALLEDVKNVKSRPRREDIRSLNGTFIKFHSSDGNIAKGQGSNCSRESIFNRLEISKLFEMVCITMMFAKLVLT